MLSLYDEFFGLCGRFGKRGLPYAVIGGIAMALYGKPRFTKDIDLLVPFEAIERVRKIMQDAGYDETAQPWRFKNSGLVLHRFMKVQGAQSVLVDVLAADDPTRLAMIDRAESMPWEGGAVRVVTRPDLVTLKGARASDQDMVDIKGISDDAH